ncbi:MAG: drug resistance transporter, EmrB/QacA subfamily [Ilumatobacteraceae bacterium]|nr:drug resistance transporter, EmrB/QacA subfamily [Ilumatobacteraceae bacterium]
MPTAAPPMGAPSTQADPKRWIGLVVLSSALFIIVLDNTILNVAVPTIVRDFHTNVSSLQWVISGYSLVFASLLISFGRLGDILGRRRLFFAGAAMFAVGSLVASLSHSVVQLFIGESLLEGIGAAAMLPATLSIISATFQGRERGSAFAVWGAVAGGAGALGPFLGGILTTNYSWRWAFRINVVIAPLAILAGLKYVRDSRDERAKGVDPAGVVVVTVGLLGLVFGIIEASRYGWFSPITGTKILGLSPVPWSLLVAAIMLAVFVVLERRRAAAEQAVVFDFRDLVHKGFRYGLINTGVLAMGEFGAFFVIPIFLQAGLHFTAIKTGTWLLPAGGAVFVGARIGGLISAKFGPKYVITAGLGFEALGIGLYALAFSNHTTLLQLLPGLLFHGIGIGFATSQLTSVVLSDIPPAKAGSASGASGMVRQVGTSLGIALIGAVFASQSASKIRSGLGSITGLTQAVKDKIVESATSFGGSAPGGADPRIGKVVSSAIVDGTRDAVLLACGIVVIGALLSTLVPNIPADAHPGAPAGGH